MDISAQYNPIEKEDKWYQYWIEQGFFHSTPDGRKPYTIVIPPPNVTGVLHMGHMLNNTIQDVLVRRARMEGKNACWVPGTDHASIATEAKVVALLKEKGIEKKSLTRAEFLKYAWQWKEEHGDIILKQLKKLGASCDWERTKFTMDDDLYQSVIKVFIDLYDRGYIYRGVRMVNWDPKAQTAISDEEILYTEEKSKLYYFKYPIKGEKDRYVTIATTRPETILGDTAVCVHPGDKRFKDLKGKKVSIPLINREVPIIEDPYVDREFGTGCLKITPAHDLHDYEIAQKHHLEVIDIFNDNGTLNEKAQLFIGQDRFTVRDEITKKLKEEGFLVKIEDYENKVGRSERTREIIEPKLSMQWFLKMEEISQPALKNVVNNTIQLHPPQFKNTYKYWMENIKDWCISRQLWWGQRIPAFYLPNGEYVIAASKEEALKKAIEKTKDKNMTEEQLTQDPDVLDTWFSSWLWPISVFDGINDPDNKEIAYYYPTDDLVTAPEILFFWVARMIVAGYKYKKERPFKNVYLTGIVRDKKRHKMSKSLGNSPDPIELIKKYGADGVRVGMLLCSPAGGDLLFDEILPEQGRNFANKVWNTLRLIKSWEVDDKMLQPDKNSQAIEWFENKLDHSLKHLDDLFRQYRLSEALMHAYTLLKEEFSSWYLEAIKPPYQKPIDSKTYVQTIELFEKLLKLLHPFMPFITEEIWHTLKKRSNGESIMITQMPKAKEYNQKLVDQFEITKEIVRSVRAIRKEKNIPLKEGIKLYSHSKELPYFKKIIQKLAHIKELTVVGIKPESSLSFRVMTNEYYIPVENLIDKTEEVKKIKKELKYTEGFLNTVMKKLNNEKFVNNAHPKVVETEQKKKKDAEEKIKLLKDTLLTLK